jgi:hypothetical protein
MLEFARVKKAWLVLSPSLVFEIDEGKGFKAIHEPFEASPGPLGHPSKKPFVPGQEDDQEIRFSDLLDAHDNGR